MQKCQHESETGVPKLASFFVDTLVSCSIALRDAHNVSVTAGSANDGP